jgi:hypothetical protein
MSDPITHITLGRTLVSVDQLRLDWQSLPTTILSISRALRQKCASYQKISIVCGVIFAAAVIAPIAMGLVMGFSATLLGIGIGAAAVALAALITLIYYQIHSSRSHQWLDIVNRIQDLDTTPKAEELFKRLSQLSSFYGKQWVEQNIYYSNFYSQANALWFLDAQTLKPTRALKYHPVDLFCFAISAILLQQTASPSNRPGKSSEIKQEASYLASLFYKQYEYVQVIHHSPGFRILSIVEESINPVPQLAKHQLDVIKEILADKRGGPLSVRK